MVAVTTDMKEITRLKREITKLNKNHDEEMEVQRDMVAAKVRVFESDKRLLQTDVKQLAEKLRDCTGFVGQLENVFREQQRDMKTVCEAIYGPKFNPEWQGDGPIPNMWQANVEYAAVEQAPDLDLDPMQRLLHMIWRRGHWALNPMLGRRTWEESATYSPLGSNR